MFPSFGHHVAGSLAPSATASAKASDKGPGPCSVPGIGGRAHGVVKPISFHFVEYIQTFKKLLFLDYGHVHKGYFL